MGKPSFDIIPMLSIHPSQINMYSKVEWSPYRPKRPKYEHLLKSDKKSHGKVSQQARRKVGKAVDYLLYMANDKILPDTAHGKNYNFKLAFITLTLPSKQIHSDEEIKEACLNQFLIEIRKRYKVRNYIWRAERQVNNNIHFHILVDRFIPWSELRDRWNRIINKLGYVERYRNEMKKFHKEGFKVRNDLLKHWDYQQQIKAYQKGKINDWASPNSTDIHALYRINNVKKYICKYCTKDESNKEINGRIWGCNYELSELKGATIIMDNNIKSELHQLIETLKPHIYTSDYFSIIYLSVNQLKESRYSNLYQYFQNYITQTFNQPLTNILTTLNAEPT